jgi:hypothetical protein
MVTMQVRDKYRPKLERIYPHAKHLLLCTLTGINKVVLLIDIHYLRRWVALSSRLCRGTT